jgi:hypothetical protein
MLTGELELKKEIRTGNIIRKIGKGRVIKEEEWSS